MSRSELPRRVAPASRNASEAEFLSLAENGLDVDGHSLVGAGQSVGEVSEVLPLVDRAQSEQLDGDYATAAVGRVGHSAEQVGLVHVASDGNAVVPRLEKEVVNVERAEVQVVGKVGEGHVAQIERVDGLVGNYAGAVEVIVDRAAQGRLGRGHGDAGALEEVEGIHGQRLLERHAVIAIQAGGLDGGVAKNGDLDGVVDEEPGVKFSEGVHVLDGDLLTDVDSLVLVRVGGGKVNGNEWRLARIVLEIHDALEGSHVGLDGAIGRDGRVDLHEVGVARGFGDADALNLELGVVDLALGDVGNTDEDAGKVLDQPRKKTIRGVYGPGPGRETRHTYTRQTTSTVMQQKMMR